MLPHALQQIVDGLEHRRGEVLAEVSGVAQSQADWKPAPGQWSLGEILHHLVLAEGIAGKMVSVALRRAAEAGALPAYPADAAPFTWQPPSLDDRWVVQVPEPAAPTHGQPIEDLREAMTRQGALTAKVVERLAAVDPRAVTAVHPLIGEMNAAQWIAFCEYHMRIHLRQMRDVKAAAKEG